MTRFVSRSFSAGTPQMTTWPMPIITYQATMSTPSGGNYRTSPSVSGARYLIDRFRLVVPQKDRQQEGAACGTAALAAGGSWATHGERTGCRAQRGEKHGRRNRIQLFASLHPATPHVEKPMLFVMVNASPGGVNRQVVVFCPARAACNRPRMGVDTLTLTGNRFLAPA